MSMEEWIDFMMATDDDLDNHVSSVLEKDKVTGSGLHEPEIHRVDPEFGSTLKLL
jgi:hypothetical protein